jgi:hypothetical protein
MFVATLASSNHCPKAQEALVTEVKSALHKAYATVDSTRQRKKISAVASLILLMRDSCPTLATNSHPTQPQTPKTPSVQTNSMLRLFCKKRICLDLAKAPVYIDIADKESIDTINHVLKTLEELTRTINAPVNPTAAAALTGSNNATISAHMRANNTTSANHRERTNFAAVLTAAASSTNAAATDTTLPIRDSSEQVGSNFWVIY